jgi:hypothetical protein
VVVPDKLRALGLGDCDRLSVAMALEPLFSRRVRALLATGVLALSGGAAATSVASETESQQEGVSTQPTAPPEDVGGGSEGSGSADDTALPVDLDPVLGDPAPVGDVPLDVGAPEAVPPGTSPDLGGADDLGSLEAQPRAGAPEGLAPGEPEGGLPQVPGLDAPAATPAPPVNPGRRGDRALVVGNRTRRGPQTLKVTKPAPRISVESAGDASAVSGVEAVVQTAAEPAPVAASAPLDLKGRRFHVVQRGESLWAIASARLDQQASAGAVAREVRRLWRLNRARIGTGDPDVLPVGVRLRL